MQQNGTKMPQNCHVRTEMEETTVRKSLLSMADMGKQKDAVDVADTM